MDAQTIAQLNQEIERLTRQRQALRQEERNISARERTLASQPMIGKKDLKSHLEQFLPSHLMPRNVGGYNTVAWPFWFTINFDFGAIANIDSTVKKTSSFQVTQEGALLLFAISKTSSTYDDAGDTGPYTIDKISDRQSSRQFNDLPIPYQMIGTKAKPTELPTPMLIMPNAFIDVTMGTWLAPGFSQPVATNPRFELNFHGLRIRIEDADKVLSTIFK